MPDSEPRPAAPSAGASGSRRQFLDLLIKAFFGLWGLGFVGAMGAYLRAPERERRIAERTVRVGTLDELRVGDAKLVRHGPTPFYVVRLDAERVIAVSAVCTHVRCILDFDRSRKGFACPCHDGRFDLSGAVISGPPPRPLPNYSVQVRAGEVYVQI
jgi:cytochrome b6-f complex iron-sulfur subunit